MNDIRDLIIKLNYYTEKYDEGKPEISDKEYDELYFNLVELEKETGIIYPDSPTQSIHFEKVSKLNKVSHSRPMLSLDKTKERDEVESFLKGQDWIGMFKLDGLSCRLTYIDGQLAKAETRGNGEVGEDITHNAFVIANIPQTIKTKDKIVEVDGEIICKIPDFVEFEDEYQNPRNFAAGSIRLLDSHECARRKLSFVAWELITGSDEYDLFYHRAEVLDDYGFEVVPMVVDAETLDDAFDVLDAKKEENIYPIDGYVFKFASKKYGETLGNTDHHFRNAIAFKFYDEEYETNLKYIDYDISRNGVLTPVAVFEPVTIDGTVVERASLHNISVMRETLGLYPDKNQPIWVTKKNMIIPQITRAIKNDIPHDHIITDAIKEYCPICGEPTKIITSASGVLTLVCGNDSCEGKLQNRIEHFFSKKGLDAKGISKATIMKLIDWGWVSSIKDMFYLNKHMLEWFKIPGYGPASVTKIINSIEESKNCTVEAFITALGIPLVGKTVSKKIVEYYPTWEEFRDAVGGSWSEFDGIGPEIERAINKFDYAEADELAQIIHFVMPIEEDQNAEIVSDNIKDKVFVITGKTETFKNRDELKADIEKRGGRVTGSVSSKTNYLITNTPESGTQKNLSAQKLGIPIITEAEYIAMTSK